MGTRGLSMITCLIFCVLTSTAAQAQDKGTHDIAAERGRIGWKGPIEEWYWLVGNPRRIAPDFFFGDDPFIDAAMRANPRTRTVLYEGTPPILAYQKGKRPMLEEIVGRVTANSKSDSERVEALLKWVYDLRTDPKAEKGRFAPALPEAMPADPNAEEYLIKNASGSCEWVTRLFVALAQVTGLPARLVMRRIHTQAEVYLEGRWVLVCPLMGDHGERFLNQKPGVFAGKSAMEVYDAKDPRQEIAVAHYYLAEERRVRWLKLSPASGKSGLKNPLPPGKPDLAYSFTDGKLALQPIPQPGPPEPLYMVPPKWSVARNRLRVDFTPGLFFHLNQAVASEDCKDAGIAVTIAREPLGTGAPGLAGVVFRSRGQNYNAVLLQDEHAVLVVRVEDGWKTRVLARFPVPLGRTQAAELCLLCRNDTVRVWLDGRFLGEVSEGLWPVGKVGVAAVQSASFSDFRVWLKAPDTVVAAAPTRVVQSDELRVPDVLEWDRLLLDAPIPPRDCQPEYSTDGGKTWHAVASDHALGEVDPAHARIRFRLKLPADAPARLGVAYRVSPDLRPAARK